jgi:3-oxoacyl-[acyl-carrier-protein] synthase III
MRTAAQIRGIAYSLPEEVITNQDLARIFPDWAAQKIEEKTGIAERHVAREGQCSSDLAVEAAGRLFAGGSANPDEIDYLLLCTQSPDYVLPATACLLQERLGIPTSAGAIDFNQGCSGFVYGLSLAKGLIETEQASKVLLLTAETYTHMLHPEDRAVRALFGDAATATFLSGGEAEEPAIGPFLFGTDGRGAPNLIVRTGAARQPSACGTTGSDKMGNLCSPDHVYMNGPEIFNFTLKTVPQSVNALLAKAGIGMETVDRFIFHQANEYMLDHLRRKMAIPREKFVISLRGFGNTVSSTIPIALAEASRSGQIEAGQLLMLVGFGVGYSWSATLVRWPQDFNRAKS